MKKIKVQIKGKEKFIIKLLKGLKIDIYDIKYINEKSIYLINFDDLKKIPKSLILSQSDTLKDRLFRHKEFIISIITGIVLIIFLSHIIVNVKIMNNDKNIRTIMQKELKKYGVKPFTIRKKYEDLKQIKKQIISDYKNIFEWIEIEPRGMVYIVRIEKRIITKEKRKDYYCDIISTKDAIIRSIESFNGQNRLYVNDYVLKGETIISGDIISNEEVKSKVCADGTVIGNTWYNVNIKYPRYHMKKIYTKKKSYNIAVDVAADKNFDDGNGNSGSTNYFYFQLIFKNGKRRDPLFRSRSHKRFIGINGAILNRHDRLEMIRKTILVHHELNFILLSLLLRRKLFFHLTLLRKFLRIRSGKTNFQCLQHKLSSERFHPPGDRRDPEAVNLIITLRFLPKAYHGITESKVFHKDRGKYISLRLLFIHSEFRRRKCMIHADLSF